MKIYCFLTLFLIQILTTGCPPDRNQSPERIAKKIEKHPNTLKENPDRLVDGTPNEASEADKCKDLEKFFNPLNKTCEFEWIDETCDLAFFSRDFEEYKGFERLKSLFQKTSLAKYRVDSCGMKSDEGSTLFQLSLKSLKTDHIPPKDGKEPEDVYRYKILNFQVDFASKEINNFSGASSYEEGKYDKGLTTEPGIIIDCIEAFEQSSAGLLSETSFLGRYIGTMIWDLGDESTLPCEAPSSSFIGAFRQGDLEYNFEKYSMLAKDPVHTSKTGIIHKTVVYNLPEDTFFLRALEDLDAPSSFYFLSNHGQIHKGVFDRESHSIIVTLLKDFSIKYKDIVPKKDLDGYWAVHVPADQSTVQIDALNSNFEITDTLSKKLEELPSNLNLIEKHSSLSCTSTTCYFGHISDFDHIVFEIELPLV